MDKTILQSGPVSITGELTIDKDSLLLIQGQVGEIPPQIVQNLLGSVWHTVTLHLINESGEKYLFRFLTGPKHYNCPPEAASWLISAREKYGCDIVV